MRQISKYSFVLASCLLLTSVCRGQSIDLNWNEDSTQCWYVKNVDGGRKFFLVDVAAKSNQPAFDHQQIKKQIAEMTDQELSSVGVNQFGFADKPGHFFIRSGASYYRVNGENNKVEAIDQPPSLKSARRLFLPPRTGTGSRGTTLKVENKTDQVIEMMWVQGPREFRSYGKIEPGQSWSQNSYVGHVWLLQSADGVQLGCFATEANDVVIIDSALLEGVERSRNTRRRFSNGGRRGAVGRSGNGSPDGKYRVNVRDHNLWMSLQGQDDDEPVQLTEDADEKNTFQRFGSGTRWYNLPEQAANRGEMRWSPDSRFFVATQTKTAPERRVYFIENSPRDQLQPKLQSYQYPKPGDPLPVNRLRLFSSEDQKEIPVSNELFENPYSLRFIGWSDNCDRFWLHYNQRGHQVLRLLEVSTETGNVKTLIEETSDTFIHYSDRGKSTFEDLPGGEILWASERSGWNHLYRYDRDTGDLLNAVTSGEWNVKRIENIDRENKVIWFYAVGVHGDQDPYHEHFCRVNFDGSNFQILTDGDGTHSISFEQERQFLKDTYSRVDMAAVVELRNAVSGELIAELYRGDTKAEFGSRRLTERFVAKGRDGETDIWGIIHWPRDFDPDKKYPVIESIYAGPHDHHVPKSFRSNYGSRYTIADAGFIVVQIDGMGTAWRSKEFHDVCFKNLRDAGFPDRIAWMKAAAEKYPQMDITRVGIFGGSAGGQNAMAALLWHNDFYSVAVADCGCHDNRMDKIWWNEQWMGWPVDDSYAENSNMENAHLLKGNLMLALGGEDRNVDPASTYQVVEKLIEANKDFEFVLIPSGGHGAGGGRWGARKRLNFFIEHLQDQ